MTLDNDGAVHFARVAHGMLPHLHAFADTLPGDQAGVRLTEAHCLHPLLAAGGPIGKLAAARLGPDALPVRAILFDKSAETNWALGWHQDRTIAVRNRIETPGFGPWSIKAGMQHVEPPAHLLAGMLTMRVHLDPVPETNAPLLIAPGSHRLGRIAESDIESVVSRCGTIACLAEAGDVWLYATPILHASARSALPARRRVLQVDFAARELPGGLEWMRV